MTVVEEGSASGMGVLDRGVVYLITCLAVRRWYKEANDGGNVDFRKLLAISLTGTEWRED